MDATAPTAMCPRCAVPVVCTFAFRRAEFYCLDCGRCLGWLDPDSAATTPALLADSEARAREFEENAGRHLIVSGSRLDSCEKCKAGEDHPLHVTEAEKVADATARTWLVERLVTNG